MVQHYCHGLSISTHPWSVLKLFKEASDVWKWIVHGSSVGPVVLVLSTALTETTAQPIWDYFMV